jgi:glucokinase
VSTLAIDIGGTKLAVAYFNAQGQMIRRKICPTDREGGREAALAAIEPILLLWNAELEIDHCGVGFGGPVDFATQHVALSTHVAGWSGFPLREWIEDRLRVTTMIDNDANVGALGEALYGAGRGARPLFYMTVSTGLGGGLVLDGDAVYRGGNSWACEIGHMTVRPDGPECLCGARGCLERMCSGLWLERDHGRKPEELFQDPEFVARYAVDLGLGVKAALMILNPARVVIGGGISQAGERLLGPLRAELARQMPSWSGATYEIARAALGTDSVLWGAYAMATQAG